MVVLVLWRFIGFGFLVFSVLLIGLSSDYLLLFAAVLASVPSLRLFFSRKSAFLILGWFLLVGVPAELD